MPLSYLVTYALVALLAALVLARIAVGMHRSWRFRSRRRRLPPIYR